MRTEITYSESSDVVYCKCCGQLAGEPSKCTAYTEHSFARTTVSLICKRCGASIGRSTRCTSYTCHDFRSVPE